MFINSYLVCVIRGTLPIELIEYSGLSTLSTIILVLYSTYFRLKNGVKQGGVLPPTLFNLYINEGVQPDVLQRDRAGMARLFLKYERAEMQMISWMCGISLKDRRTNEELRRLVGVEPITTFIRSGRLRWYGHVMRTG